MGHSSIQITVDTYGHLIPGANKAAVDDHSRSIQDSAAAHKAAAEQAQVTAQEVNQIVASSVGNFVGAVVTGTRNIAEAFQNLIQSIIQELIAQATARAVLSILPFAAGGNLQPVNAAAGMNVVRGGIPGTDSILTKMQAGERVLSVSRNDQFERILDRLDRGQAPGGAAKNIHVTVNASFSGSVSRRDAKELVKQIGPQMVDYLTGIS